MPNAGSWTGRCIRGRTEQRSALRADIVLAAAEGHSNAWIAASMGICQDIVRKVAALLVRRSLA